MERLVNRTRWEEATGRATRYRMACDQMAGELLAARAALQQSRQRVSTLETQLAQAHAQIQSLEARLAALTPPFAALPQADAPAPARLPPPPFVKANHATTPAKAPGQKPGHAPAHRSAPARIDQTVDVPLPKDRQGRPSCPHCFTQLQQIHTHRRLVEDLVPRKRVVTCYKTASGYCPGCRTTVESRAEDQPPVKPGVDLPQSQLGINTLATGALLRMVYRLPYRQITALFADLPNLAVSAGAVARQVKRMGHWLEGPYQRLKENLRRHTVVHMDETGWRVGGVNHWLWTLTGGKQTVYHINQSRGGEVARGLLGDTFKGTLVSDFFGAYNGIDCAKQKCLAHWARELHETAQLHPAFATGAFYRRAVRLLKAMLLLKARQQQEKERGGKRKRQRGKGRAPPQAIARYEKRVLKIEQRIRQLAQGPPGGWKEKEATRLAKRLARHGRELTHLLRHAEVPATNNAAERALRPAVVARKISGGNRGEKNARAESVLRSILTTLHQQHKPLLETFKTLLRGHWSGQDSAELAALLCDSC